MKNISIKTIEILGILMMIAKGAYAQATISSLDQNADNANGQYTPMNMDYAGFGSLGMVQSAWLDPLQNLGEGQSKPAYSKYYWSPDLVLPIRLREGMMTLINFPEWEMVEDIYIGDSSMFDGQISGPNTLLMYPKSGAKIGVDTNVIVFGRSGNKYVFYAKSEGVNTERLTNSIIDIEVIDNQGANKSGSSNSKSAFGTAGNSHVNASAWNSHSVDSRFTKRYQHEDWIKNIPMDPTKFRFDIEVYVPNPDDVIIAPERVWRDDIFTYIDLGEKSLSMVQRPIVTLLVERIETPVGFRTKGPNNRLIIVEGIGDMVMRNGKRIVCLKLRRDDADGLEFTPKYEENGWDVAPTIPDGKQAEQDPYNEGNVVDNKGKQTEVTNPNLVNGYFGFGTTPADKKSSDKKDLDEEDEENIESDDDFDYSKMQHLSGYNGNDAGNMYSNYKYGTGFNDTANANISVELGTDSNVSNLEDLWSELSSKYSKVLGKYQPFYSVDTPADGQGKELFHLRVGPVKDIKSGDGVCSHLGRNGVFCSVVRIQ